MRSAPFRILAPILLWCALACSQAERPAPATGPEGPLDEAGMKAAISAALEIPDTLERVTATVALMPRIDEDNLEGAIEAYREHLLGVDRAEVRLFANRWAQIDPRDALDRLVTWRQPLVARQAIAEVVHYWTRHGGAKAAREYALSTIDAHDSTDVTSRNVVVDATLKGLASNDEYEELTAMFETFPADRERTFLITQIMVEFNRRNMDAMRAWADSMSWDAKNDLKMAVLDVGVKSLAVIEPERAAAWFEEIEKERNPQAMLPGIAAGWATRDPESLLVWPLERPYSTGRETALRDGAYAWLKSDGAAASAWIQARLEDENVARTMLFPLAQYTMSIDYQQALPLAERIENRDQRVKALKQVLMMWSRDDYEAVKRYMAETKVPSEVEQAVRGQNEVVRRPQAPDEQG